MANLADVGSFPLTYGARRIAERAVEHQEQHGQPGLGVNHWLLALLERHGAMAESLVAGLEAAPLRREVRHRLDRGDAGTPSPPRDLLGQAAERARDAGQNKAGEQALATVILAAAGYSVHAEPSYGRGPVGAVSAAAPAAGPTPTLDEFGRDLTREAREGRLPAVVGREDEIREVCRTLCRHTKRNPALIGPAGTGKTAIVEGLAQRIASGQVPEPLKDARLVALQASALVAGAGVVGELEKRMKSLLQEAAQPGVVLFFDELHSIVGSGGTAGRQDVSALLKPALGRGEISCVGATTDDEYRQNIESDRALERRFRPIAVEEMSPQDTFVVLTAHRDYLERLRGVQVPDQVLHWLIGFCRDFLRNRAFPDKAVDLLEQCVATAVIDQEAQVSLEQAEQVAHEMVGMPIDLETRLEDLGRRLAQSGLLGDEQIEALQDRVAVTMRGLDFRPAIPNSVVLLAGGAAEAAEDVCEVMAGALLGDPGRVVEIDFGQFGRDEDVNTLLGAPPAYVGFGEHLPLHDLARMPWSVALFKNVDRCDPQVRDVLAQALADGYFTERSGKRVYLSDALVVLTAPGESAAAAPMGFSKQGKPSSRARQQSAERMVGARLAEQLDVISTQGLRAAGDRRGWIEQTLLPGLAEHYRQTGLTIEWAPSLVAWAQGQQRTHPSRILLTRLVERRVGEALITRLPPPGATARVRIEAENGQLRVTEPA